MKFRLAIAVLALLAVVAPVQAVENGSNALLDPNAVSINGAGGFLYAPRIILTTAHNRQLPHELENLQVTFPGDVLTKTSKTVAVSKVFAASTYTDRTFLSGGNIFSRTDDFAVIVLSEPMQVKNTVKIATKEDLERFKANHFKANLVGYGLQSIEMRALSNNGRNQVDISPKMISTNFLTDEEAQTIVRNSLGGNAIYKQDAYFAQNSTTGSFCDNDSGSGWFVDFENVRYYIGAQSGGWGVPNCSTESTWGNFGSFASVSAAYRFTALIAEAEIFVVDHPYIQPLPANTTSPATPKAPAKKILCQKGKVKKYFTSTKCPTGYKLVK